jgi:hypothetical protein
MNKAELGLPRIARAQLLHHATVTGGSRWQASADAQKGLNAYMELLGSNLKDFADGRYKSDY